jgi:ribonuclease HI
MKPFVRLFTDGACSGNPGPGGWAFILRHEATGKELVASGGEPTTTNNRMELLAVIRGLEALKKPCRVDVVTDSQYVGLEAKWLEARQGTRRAAGEECRTVAGA